jgi:hypothetical protein
MRVEDFLEKIESLMWKTGSEEIKFVITDSTDPGVIDAELEEIVHGKG